MTKSYKSLLKIRLVCLLLSLSILSGSCSEPAKPPSEPTPIQGSGTSVQDPGPTAPARNLPISTRNFLVGTAGVIPPNFPNSSEEDYLVFLDEVPHTGELLGAYMDWTASDVIETIQFVDTYAVGVEPLIALGFDFDLVDDTYFSRHLPEIRNTIREVLDTFDLEYLAFGVEVNRLIPEVSEAAFLDFVNAYRDIYDLVKYESPNTKVFTIFQLEYLKGTATLSGLEFDPHWEVLDLFTGKQDLVGLTVYPFLEYPAVGEIPIEYYKEIPEMIDLPVAITEMAWLSEDVSIVQGSEGDQVTFLLGILESTQSWNLEMMLYSFLYEPQGMDLFESAALNTTEGDAKEIYYYWLSLAALERE
ncbi:MAG: hypothetical protein WBB69_13285 [Anaerolineales bacterium]